MVFVLVAQIVVSVFRIDVRYMLHKLVRVQEYKLLRLLLGPDKIKGFSGFASENAHKLWELGRGHNGVEKFFTYFFITKTNIHDYKNLVLPHIFI